MIESILSFSLRSMICSAVFVAYYLLALKNARMHSFNRIYLLAAAFLSLVLPFARLELFNISPVAVPDFPLLHISGKGAEEVLTNTATANTLSWSAVLATLYFILTTVMVLRLLIKSIWVYTLRKRGQEVNREGFLLIKTDDPHAPFSFMNMLFFPTGMHEDSPEGRSILAHELAHIKQHHTLEKIFMQLMLAASWLNPFNWLIRNELWLQHEFLADKHAIHDGNSETFARMLLYSVTGSSNRSIINPFFQSPIKRRLIMLTQPAQSTYAFMRRFLSIPVLFTAILLLATNSKTSNAFPTPKKIVLVLDAAHGGTDAGATSKYGQMEKDITLAICRKLVALSAEYNIQTITTRNEDAYPTLKERVRISNSTDNAIFLSVHVNKSKTTDARSNNYQLGVAPKGSNYSRSMLLASAIAGKLKLQKLPVEVVDQMNAYVIRENTHPALLIECGNLDDADNMALLSDEARSETLCRNILSGIVDYNARLR